MRRKKNVMDGARSDVDVINICIKTTQGRRQADDILAILCLPTKIKKEKKTTTATTKKNPADDCHGLYLPTYVGIYVLCVCV